MHAFSILCVGKNYQSLSDKDNEVEASEADDESEKADESHNASPRRKISVKKDKKQSKARNVFVDVSENVSPELPGELDENILTACSIQTTLFELSKGEIM